MSLSKMEIMMEVMQERMREMQREMKAMEDRNETMRIQQKEEMKTMERKYEERIEDLEKKCPSTLIQSEMKFENGRLWRECERISSVYDNCFIELSKGINDRYTVGPVCLPLFVKINITELNLWWKPSHLEREYRTTHLSGERLPGAFGDCKVDYKLIDFKQINSLYKLTTFEIDFAFTGISPPTWGSNVEFNPSFKLINSNSVTKFICINGVEYKCHAPYPQIFPSFPNLIELHFDNCTNGYGGFIEWLETKCPLVSSIYINKTMPCSHLELKTYCSTKGISLKLENCYEWCKEKKITLKIE